MGPQQTQGQPTLLDFGTSQGNQLSDFVPDQNTVAPVTNDASNRNMAAHVALLSGDPKQAIDTYSQTRADLSQSGQSALGQQVFDQARQSSFDQAKGVLSTMLADPTMPLQDKQNAILGVYNSNSAMYSPNNILSSKMLQAPASNNTEAEGVRFSLADVMNAVNDTKRQQQIMVNAEIAKTQNDNMLDKASDVLGTALPFSNQANVGRVGQQFGGSAWDRIKSVFAPGQETQDVRDRLLRMSPDDRVQATQDLIGIINNNSGIVMQTDNDFRKVQDLQKFIADGGYSNADKWADDFSAAADLVTGVGGAVKDFSEAAKAARASAAEEEAWNSLKGSYNGPQGSSTATGGTTPKAGPGGTGKAIQLDLDNPQPRQNTVVDTTQPASPAMNVKDTNPVQYQNLHEAAAADTSGESAQALYGTDRNSVIASDLSQEVARADGSVKAKVATPDQINNQTITPDPELKHYVDWDGAIYYTDAEKVAQSSRVVNDFQQAIGMTDRKEMFQVQHLDNDLNGNTVRIKAVYGPQDSGFSDPDDAMNMAQWTLRKYGIGPDDIQLLQRVGGDYVPVDYVPGGMSKGQAPKSTTSFTGDPGFRDYSQGWNLSDADIQQAHDEGHYATATTTGGQKVHLTGVVRPGGDVREVHAFDQQGNRVGSVVYGQGGDRIDNPNVRVNPEWQRKGVASAMYDYAEKHGAKFPGVDSQKNLRTQAGQAFREGRASSGLPDYLVQVNHDYKLTPSNQDLWSDMDVKNNFWMTHLGSLAPEPIRGEGSIQSMLVNKTSMFDPHLIMGMSTGVLKEGNIERELLTMANNKFAKPYNALPAEARKRVESLILHQNYMGYEAGPVQMSRLGMTNEEQEVMRGWRQTWDQIYYLENHDHTKTLINQGYKKFIDSANDTMLYARPVSRGSIGNSARVWNHNTDSMETWGKEALDEHYNRKGTLAEVRSPFKVGDEMANYIASPETKEGGYLRGIKPDDTTLNYRKGYFHVQYKDPHFIIKQEKNSKGKVLYEKAIATARNAREADIMTKRLQKTDAYNGYYHRPDMKHMVGDRANSTRTQYDMATSQGRSPQRVRGRRLEDTTQQAIDPNHTNVVSPAQSLINSSRSIARRTAMRDPIDAAKNRFLSKYGKYLEKRGDEPLYPTDINAVKYRGQGQFDKKDLGAARSTFEFINYMEHGYENHLEDAYDALLKGVGDVLAKKSIDYNSKVLAKGEQIFHTLASHNSPLQKAQAAAYSIYIAANPLRQMLMHGHQALDLLAIHPTFFATPKPYTQVMYLLSRHLGIQANEGMLKAMGMDAKAADDLWTQWRHSGMTSAIDKHALIRSGLRTLADEMNKRPLAVAGRAASYPFYIARKIGFDAGEFYTQMMGWLTHRDLAIRAGEDLGKKDVQDWITAKATNFTGNFNRSGDLSYNHNSLSAVMQFFQWSHKWTGLVTGNRMLSTKQKLSLIGTTIGLFGVPFGTAGMYLMDRFMGDKAPKDQATRDTLQGGIVGAMYNAMLSYAFDDGKHERVDFESLSPSDVMGIYDHINDLFNGKIGSVIADSPAGLLFGGNTAINNFWKSAARYGHLMYDDQEHPEQFSDVIKNFAMVFPGLSNGFKAAYAWQANKKINAYTGKIEDTNILHGESLAQLFGMPTLNQTNGAFAQERYLANKELVKQDFNYWYDTMKMKALSDGMDPTSLAYAQRISSEYWRMVGSDNEYAHQLFTERLKQDDEQGDRRLFQQVIDMAHMAQSGVRIGSYDDARAIINEVPNATAEQKATYLNIINTIQANSSNTKLPKSVLDKVLDKGE